MTKEAVIKARTLFGTNPTKIICDNMIILYDHVPNSVNIIWDDSDETLMCIRPNTNTDINGNPLSILFTTYEHIQFIESYLDKSTSMDYISSIKTEIGEDEHRKLMNLYIQNLKK